MNAERLIKQLEKAISKGQRPEKKIQAHCLLAKLYHRKGDETKAHKHFTKAKEKFFDMYENGIKRLENAYLFGNSEEIKKEEIKVEKMLKRYKSKLIHVGKEIDRETIFLWMPD